jgi:hypothetical protein
MTMAAERHGRKHECKHMDVSVLSLRPRTVAFLSTSGALRQ